MNNQWLTKGTDRPLIYNIIEWCGFDKCKYIDKIIYNYVEHENNSYKTINYSTKMLQLNYLSDITPKVQVIEDIHIVMCVYKRPFNLITQLTNLNNQTVCNRIYLHVINNNNKLVEIFEDLLNDTNNKLKYQLYNYDNTYFGYQRFLTIKDEILKNHNMDYVIIIDDDQVFPNDWVEKMYNLRTPKTYYSWYVKKWCDTNLDYWNGSLINISDCKKNKVVNLDNFHYGGTGGSIIDVNIFNQNSELWNIPNDLPINISIYNIEDLWLSYVIIYYYKWNIKRSFLPEDKSFNATNVMSDTHSLWRQIQKEKQILFEYLFTQRCLKNFLTK